MTKLLVVVAIIFFLQNDASGFDSFDIPDDILRDFSDSSGIEQFIRSQIGRIRSMMRSGDALNSIPKLDPYNQDSSLNNTFKVSTSFAEASVRIFRSKVTGMSNFKLKDLSVNVKERTLLLAIEVPEIRIQGEYETEGTFRLAGPVPIDGKGSFSAVLYRPTARVLLMVNYENGTGYSVSGTNVEVDYEDIEFDLEGFMPGKPLGPIILRAIKARSRDYFEETKGDLEVRLGEFLAKTINAIFDDVVNETPAQEQVENVGHVIQKRQSCGSGNMNSYIDQVLENARPIIRQKADPLKLKDFKRIASFYDGKVTGLSSIYRTGDVVLSCSSESLTLKVNMGVKNVKADYRWKRKIIFFTLRGRLEGKVKSVTISATMTQPRESGAHPVITHLDLKFKRIRLHLTGLSIIGHLISAILSLLTNIFRKAVANAVEKPIKKVIQSQLNKITLPF